MVKCQNQKCQKDAPVRVESALGKKMICLECKGKEFFLKEASKKNKKTV